MDEKLIYQRYVSKKETILTVVKCPVLKGNCSACVEHLIITDISQKALRDAIKNLTP